jgi:hypothetical protein
MLIYSLKIKNACDHSDLRGVEVYAHQVQEPPNGIRNNITDLRSIDFKVMAHYRKFSIHNIEI